MSSSCMIKEEAVLFQKLNKLTRSKPWNFLNILFLSINAIMFELYAQGDSTLEAMALFLKGKGVFSKNDKVLKRDRIGFTSAFFEIT